MKLFFTLIILLFINASLFSQRMSVDKYWIPLNNKEFNNFDISQPEKFLSEKAILRRKKNNVSIIEEDLPVSKYYIDSLNRLGLKIIGSSKWFNSVVVESNDILLIDSIDYLSFVNEFDYEYTNFGFTSLNHIQTPEVFKSSGFSAINYGESYKQISLLRGIDLHELGFKAKGMEIAVIDGGFYQLDSFAVFNKLWENNQILAFKDFVNPQSNIFEENSHGMSVMSTIAVNEPGNYIGTAPDASFYLLRSEDGASENKVEEAYWIMAAEYADSAGADVITSSLGYTNFDIADMDYSPDDLDGHTALISKAANIAFSKGMMVIVSAGNSGNEKWKKINPPADASNVLAVGSIDTSEKVSAFSSRGYTTDNRIKPDVLAVGYQTQIINAQGFIGDGYGTSFSAPQIAGLTACLWQSMPDITNTELLQAIRESSDHYSHPDINRGFGIPNFSLARWLLQRQKNISTIDPYIYPNPFVEHFTIKLNQIINQIEIYTITGILVYSDYTKKEAGEIVEINLDSKYSRGIYLIKFKNNKQSIVKKIIRQ